MPATPRDLLKPHVKRVGEVYSLNALQAGQANSQFVNFGCVLAPGTTTSQLAISAGEVVIGQAVFQPAAVTGQVLTALTNTGAGQFCKVLVEYDHNSGSDNWTLTQGSNAASQAAAALPALTATRIAVGWLEIPASFTFGTTALTTAMCKQVAYDAGAIAVNTGS